MNPGLSETERAEEVERRAVAMVAAFHRAVRRDATGRDYLTHFTIATFTPKRWGQCGVCGDEMPAHMSGQCRLCADAMLIALRRAGWIP